MAELWIWEITSHEERRSDDGCGRNRDEGELGSGDRAGDLRLWVEGARSRVVTKCVLRVVI